jgi:hypothetical protein
MSGAGGASPPPHDDRLIQESLTSVALKRQWQHRNAEWLARAKQCLKRPSCIARVTSDRQATIASLSARLGPSTPSLDDLDAVVLRGRWTATALQRFDGRKPSYPLFNSLPASTTTVTGQPGAICYDGVCKSMGFERSAPLSSGDAREAASLGLKPAMVGWLALNNGKAEWVIYPVGKALVILTDGCLRPYDYRDCAPGFIVLTPQSSDAAMVILGSR